MTRESILETLLRESRPDAGVILSTHEIKDADPIFSRIVILREGQLLLDESVERLRAGGGSVVESYRSSMR